VHTRLECLSWFSTSYEIKIVTITLDQRSAVVPVIASSVNEDGTRLGRIELKDFEVPRRLLAVDLRSRRIDCFVLKIPVYQHNF